MGAGWVTVLGTIVTVVAVALLGFAVFTTYEIVRDPGRLNALKQTINQSTAGPNASFSWSSQGYNVTFTDTSTDSTSTITTWAWEFGDGSGSTKASPAPHEYNATCGQCTETVTLAVQDADGHDSAATANVQVQRVGSANGVSSSNSSGIHIPSLGPLTSGLPGAVELLLIMFLAGGSVAKAGWNLLRRDPETVSVPVRPALRP